jgi:hypothetical protein
MFTLADHRNVLARGLRNNQEGGTMKNSTTPIHEKKSFLHHDPHSDLGHQILEALERERDYDLEELLHAFPDYTWNQVFLEVDRMSRTGELRLFVRGLGLYTICLPLPTTQHILKERLMVSA